MVAKSDFVSSRMSSRVEGHAESVALVAALRGDVGEHVAARGVAPVAIERELHRLQVRIGFETSMSRAVTTARHAGSVS